MQRLLAFWRVGISQASGWPAVLDRSASIVTGIETASPGCRTPGNGMTTLSSCPGKGSSRRGDLTGPAVIDAMTERNNKISARHPVRRGNS
jgi:hypothetical protein